MEERAVVLGKLMLRGYWLALGLVRRVIGCGPFESFDSEDAMLINRARQDHLASLGLNLVHQSILEVGAGVGRHTAFFEKLSCAVISTDARAENVAEHLRRFPHRQGRVFVADLSVPGSHQWFGQFDIVYCYGALYHLRDPTLCIRELAKNCRKLFLLETCVNPTDNGEINPVIEDRDNTTQSFDGVGCRPARDWVMQQLRQNFPFAYVTVTQPNHPDFELSWPVSSKRKGLFRSVFVASRSPLVLPSLSSTLLAKQTRLAAHFSGEPHEARL